MAFSHYSTRARTPQMIKYDESVAWNDELCIHRVHTISLPTYLIRISKQRENERVVKIYGGIIVLKPVLVARQSNSNSNGIIKARIDVTVEHRRNFEQGKASKGGKKSS